MALKFELPSDPKLMFEVMKAIQDLGGSGTIWKIESAAVKAVDPRGELMQAITQATGSPMLLGQVTQARKYCTEAQLVENVDDNRLKITVKGLEVVSLPDKQAQNSLAKMLQDIKSPPRPQEPPDTPQSASPRPRPPQQRQEPKRNIQRNLHPEDIPHLRPRTLTKQEHDTDVTLTAKELLQETTRDTLDSTTSKTASSKRGTEKEKAKQTTTTRAVRKKTRRTKKTRPPTEKKKHHPPAKSKAPQTKKVRQNIRRIESMSINTPTSQNTQEDLSAYLGDEEEWYDDLKQSLHEQLRELTTVGLKQFVLNVLGTFELELRHTNSDEDDNDSVDAIGTAPISPLLSTTIAVQVNRNEPDDPIGRDHVTLFQRDAQARGAEHGIIVSLEEYSENAISAFSGAALPVELIDGQLLCDMVIQKRIGIRFSPYVASEFFEQFEE
ncbi:MAG: restriction endonuclease [Acidimicrobiaceae bacterium]|nr:restriction endonuclease [Acidimicrobiaceae bacterium]